MFCTTRRGTAEEAPGGRRRVRWYLCEKGSGDEDLHYHGDDQLKDEQDNGDRTLLRDAPEAVADRGLRLQREEEGSCQGLHLHDTRGVVGWGVELCRSRRGRREEELFFRCKIPNQPFGPARKSFWRFCFYPADLRAPWPPGTRALRRQTRSLQRWQRRGRTCSATAYPGKSSTGRGGRGPPARSRARSEHCSGRLWRGLCASFSEHQGLRHPFPNFHCSLGSRAEAC